MIRPLAVWLPLLGCQDYTTQELSPEIDLSTERIDFGEVVVGKQSEIGILVENVGRGVLHVESCELDGTTSPDFELVPLEADRVEPGESLVLAVRYVPDLVGQDFGRVVLTADDPATPTVGVDLSGFGVQPDIDIDPETLWFGDLAVGEQKTLPVQVAAAGTGSTWISDISFADDLGAFSLTLPEEVVLPYGLQAGFSFELLVTFAPIDASACDTELLLQSNDPDEPIAAVRLLGNAEDIPGDEPPEVEITDPNWGNYLVHGEPTELSGHVVDLEDDPRNLTCAWYAGTTFLGNSTPDGDGNISLVTDDLPIGEIDILLVAMDTAQQTGSDFVQVTVWDAEEPIRYVLSGGVTIYDYWAVDDDIEILVDGVAVFADTNRTQDNHPPVEFDASVGSVITLQAWDINECRQKLDALYLHFGTGLFVQLTEPICRASCPTDECFDPTYAGPWPNLFLDEDYEITIP